MNQDLKTRHIGAGTLLALHLFIGGLMLAAALHLHTLTLDKIRAFHPQYPQRMTVKPYMPVWFVHPFHAAGPVVLSVVTLATLLVSAAPAVRKRDPGPMNVVVVGLNLAVLCIATYAYAIAAVQLAGIAALLVKGSR